jgi:hypothetical protein
LQRGKVISSTFIEFSFGLAIATTLVVLKAENHRNQLRCILENGSLRRGEGVEQFETPLALLVRKATDGGKGRIGN